MTPSNASCLLLIDIQNDFVTNWALPVPQGEVIVPICNRLIKRFSHVVATQDWHPPDHLSFAESHPGKSSFDTVDMPYGKQILWPKHCIQSTPGADFHPQLDQHAAQLIIRKGTNRHIDSYSAFNENDKATTTGLAGYLQQKQITDLYFCGLALDFCVAWSVHDAKALGFTATVVTDACKAMDHDGSLDRTMTGFRQAGIRLCHSDDVQ